jgi:hypothetical protein
MLTAVETLISTVVAAVAALAALVALIVMVNAGGPLKESGRWSLPIRSAGGGSSGSVRQPPVGHRTSDAKWRNKIRCRAPAPAFSSPCNNYLTSEQGRTRMARMSRTSTHRPAVGRAVLWQKAVNCLTGRNDAPRETG